MEYDFILMVAFGQFGSEQVLVTVFASNFESPETNLSFSLPKTSIFPLTTGGTTLKFLTTSFLPPQILHL